MDDLEPMETAWDRMSADYAQRLKLAPTDAHYLAIAEQIPPADAPMEILDLGCGLGFELDAILGRAPHASIVAVDISQRMLDRLLQRLKPYARQIQCRHGSYVDLPPEPNRYDYVVSSLTMHHLPQPTKRDVFRRIRDCLKPAGRYLQADEVASPEQEKVGQAWYDEWVSHRPGGNRGDWNHNMPLTIEHESTLLRQAGFDPVLVPWTSIDNEGYGKALFVATRH